MPKGPGGLRRTVKIEQTKHLYTASDDVIGMLFVEVSSLTGENVTTPFLLAGRNILSAIDAGTLDPDAAGTGVSYGERQLRAVGSSSRLSSAFGGTTRRKGRRKSVSLGDMVGNGRRCSC